MAAALAAACVTSAAAGQRSTPQIPAEFRTIVTAVSPDLLQVRGLDGNLIPVEIEYYEPPTDYRLYLGGRFLGFSLEAHEADGYIIVDRASGGAAAVLETGDAPTFSQEGRFFAAAEMSEAAWGNLEGLAVWEVLPDRTVRRFFTNAVPRTFDWRVDRWAGPTCVELSAIDLDWRPPGDQDQERAMREAPRAHFSISIGEEIVLREAQERSACAEVP